MEAYQFVRREMEGAGTEIGWECTPTGQGETDTSWLLAGGYRPPVTAWLQRTDG